MGVLWQRDVQVPAVFGRGIGVVLWQMAHGIV